MSETLSYPLDVVNNINMHVGRAKATADLLNCYFENIGQPLAELLDETIAFAFDSIVSELDAISEQINKDIQLTRNVDAEVQS